MTINKRYRARSVSKVAGDTGAPAPLEDAKFNNICQFLGYGNPDTPVWFLGIEEGGGDVEQLRIRATWKPFVDCKDAHERLGITKFHCTENPAYQPTWNGMCWVMLGLGGNPNSTLEQRKTYQAEKLGRSGGCTFLTELYPLPKPNESAWPPDYANALRNRFQSLEDYRAQTVDVRVNLLRKAIEAHHPRVPTARAAGSTTNGSCQERANGSLRAAVRYVRQRTRHSCSSRTLPSAG